MNPESQKLTANFKHVKQAISSSMSGGTGKANAGLKASGSPAKAPEKSAADAMDVDSGPGAPPRTTDSGGGGLRGGGFQWEHLPAPPGRMACSVQRPIMKVAEEDAKDECSLLERMREGNWTVHETFQCVVCCTAIRDEEDEPPLHNSGGEEPEASEQRCSVCAPYLAHVADGFAEDDGSLDAAMKLRDLWVAQNNRSSEVAHLQGELGATRKALTEANERVRAREDDFVATAALKMFLERQKEAAEADLADLRSRLEAMRLERNEYADKYEASAARCRELECRLDREDGNRPRKRGAPLQPKSGQNKDACVVHVVSNNKSVKASEAILHIRGLAQQIVYPTALSELVPVPLQWEADDRGMPLKIVDFDAALGFVRTKRQSAIAHVCLAKWVEAKRTPENSRDAYQTHVLNAYTMPLWHWHQLRGYARQKERVGESHEFWETLQRPQFGDPPTLMAAFLQKTESASPGCPFLDSYGTLNLRLVRGLLFWEKVAYDRKRYASTDSMCGARQKYDAVANAVINVLVIPMAYRRDISQNAIIIAPEVKLEHWPPEACEDLTDDQVVRRLAAMGVTFEMADDYWAFFHEYLRRIHEFPRTNWDPDHVAALFEAIVATPDPPAAVSKHGDIFPRPPLLPYASRANNWIQDCAVFMEGLPREEDPNERVTPAPRDTRAAPQPTWKGNAAAQSQRPREKTKYMQRRPGHATSIAVPFVDTGASSQHHASAVASTPTTAPLPAAHAPTTVFYHHPQMYVQPPPPPPHYSVASPAGPHNQFYFTGPAQQAFSSSAIPAPAVYPQLMPQTHPGQPHQSAVRLLFF